MEYLIVSAFFFLLVFLPGIFSYRIFVLIQLSFLLFLLRRKERVNYIVLFLILLFSLFSSALEKTRLQIPIKGENIRGIYGFVVSEPNRKKNRYIGFNISLESIVNERGDFFSSSGKLYVISPSLDASLGDRVYIEGVIKENYFLSSGGTIKRESVFSRARKKFNALFIKNLPKGDVGNIIALLLTGTSLDGTSDISERVRGLGLSHLISLSGMHLGFITKIVLPLLLMMVEKRKAILFKNIILFAFVYLAGFRPSLMRSLIFVILIPFFGISLSFTLSLVFLIMLFPFYCDEVATILSFTSLSGILLFSKEQEYLEEKEIPFISSFVVLSYVSVAATVMSAPVSYRIFGTWQPYAFLFSIIGMPIITLLFILTIIHFIVPISDYLIEIILYIIQKSEIISLTFPLSDSFTLYIPMCGLFLGLSLLLRILRKRKR